MFINMPYYIVLFEKKSGGGGVNLLPIDQFEFIAIDRAVYASQKNIF